MHLRMSVRDSGREATDYRSSRPSAAQHKRVPRNGALGSFDAAAQAHDRSPTLDEWGRRRFSASVVWVQGGRRSGMNDRLNWL